ncbi:MAG: hypothetical protein LQ349_002151 [Xanthoria aureola]|nr:MAG: hypothetical protein LQ349_002151 [Xanthoria aureola]
MHPGWPELAVRVEAEAGLLAEEEISLDPASASSHAQRNRVEEAGLLAEEDTNLDPASASRNAQDKRVEEEKRQAYVRKDMYSLNEMIEECWSVLSTLFANVLPGDVVDDLRVRPGKQR